jgi:organic radical activating enzyme
MNTSSHLQHKRWLIPITNACNLSCGGCAQLCGHFPPEKIWHLTLDELNKLIELIKPFTGPEKNWNEVTIFGGEPTVHKQWDQIPDLLAQHAPMQFRINTNGRLGQERFHRDRNMVYYVDKHPPDQLFLPTSIAAMDILKIEDKNYYWELAQKDCDIWATEGAMIYRDKAYYCEHAAAMDWMFYDGINGWDLQDGQNPFNKTEEEISEQASHFCHRCGWCVESKLSRQKVSDKSQVSSLNYPMFPRKQLVQLTVSDA